MIGNDILARAFAWLRNLPQPQGQPQNLDLARVSGEVAQPEATQKATDLPALAVQVACALARRFEGLYLKPYLCPAGYPTIGYGARFYPDGREVKLTDPAITREQAEAMLLHSVRTIYLPAVLKLCPNITDPNRLAAIIDFAFNLGSSRLAASTLRRKINKEEWSAVPAELRKWVFANGKKLRGLELRRNAECDLI